MADPIAAITAIGRATAAVAEEVKARSDLNNSPAMQEALVLHRVQEVLDTRRAAIQNEDLDAIRVMLG